MQHAEHVTQKNNNGWIALFALLAGVTMLFASLTSAYVERVLEMGLLKSPLPTALWVSTAILLVSSFVVELARLAARQGAWPRAKRHIGLATVLGLGFLVSQIIGWQQMIAMGYYLQSLPHSSFLYLLTLLHALHLLGAIAWLARTRVRLGRLRPVLQVAAGEQGQRRAPSEQHTDFATTLAAVSQAGVFWHYLGVLWLFLFALLFVI